MAMCGACAVHADGEATRSCVLPVSSVVGTRIRTIEGWSPHGEHAVQKAWIAEGVPQCGYCQSGQIMMAAVLLEKNPKPSEGQIVETMNGNLCRCGTYKNICAAVARAAKEVRVVKGGKKA